MKKAVLGVVLALSLSGSAIAQKDKDQSQPGRYQIVTHQLVANSEKVILLDTWTGKTWRLDSSDTWHPMTRLDTPEHVAEWKKANPPSKTKTEKLSERHRRVLDAVKE